jgi:predicted DNA-binding protein with PD1-like motif
MLSFGRSDQGFSKLSVGAAVESPPPPACTEGKATHLASFTSAHFFQPASKVHVLNIKPGADVVGCIQQYLTSNRIAAANIMSAVGTLKSVTMRLAYCEEGKGHPTRTHHGKKQKYQLVSLSGCISMHGARLSICIGDGSGTAHVGQLVGNMIAHGNVEICTGCVCVCLCVRVCVHMPLRLLQRARYSCSHPPARRFSGDCRRVLRVGQSRRADRRASRLRVRNDVRQRLKPVA